LNGEERRKARSRRCGRGEGPNDDGEERGLERADEREEGSREEAGNQRTEGKRSLVYFDIATFQKTQAQDA
jgi:hypothetical protein